MGKVTKIAPMQVAKKKLRVAAYCRVSTDSAEQLESLEAQKTYYENYIRSREDWEFAGIYFDSGITATKKEKRPELLHLIADCKAGKIDLIITKSISRFSRNTTDCLGMVRQLLALNIPIYFEKENLNTASMESELLLSILTSMAEGESVSISQNNKWAVQKRFEAGTFKISYPPYGYDENFTVNPLQAAIVKELFQAVLSGKSITKLAKDLNSRKIPCKRGSHWTASTILGMLSNEKYKGDCLFQKTYTDSGFNRHCNHGEAAQYLIENHHEAIVSKEDFEAVQALIRQRASEKNIAKGTKKYQNRYVLSGKIICGECGNTFKRRTHGSYIAWCCNTHLENTSKCSMLFVRDDALKLAFVTMMNKLIFAHKQILKLYVDSLLSSSTDTSSKQIQQLQSLITKCNEKRETLTRLMAQGIIDRILFTKEIHAISAKANQYRREMEKLNSTITGDSEKISEAKALLNFASKSTMMTTFDESLFQKFVSEIVIQARHEFCFALKCGLNFTERI